MGHVDTEPPNTSPKIGLVLGGGGISGAAFHAAALSAMEIDMGWDARNADVIVGTSAGALVGLLLRLDVSATDLAAMMSQVPQHAEHELVANGIVECPDLPEQSWRTFVPHLTWNRLLDRPVRALLKNPAAALLSLFGTGEVDFLSLMDFIPPHSWPDADLRICAVRNDLTRVVWDSNSSIPLDAAVSSSCSMPGYAQGIEFEGWTYFDGGLRSPTNADVLSNDDLDLVVVLSPMTPERPSRWTRHGVVSRFAERRLTAETSLLRERGIEVVAIRSPARVARASSGIGSSMLRPEAGGLAESFFAVGARLPQFREILDATSGR